ncbi:MAG TPA: hypothetical protein DCZ03_01660 [Gammaproteobacteria bacterium]|nr:hypothetical protein [Gammaproteobacteria bacterium]
MTTLLLTVIIVAVLLFGMSIGVILQNKPIKGSCGGLNALGMKSACEVCHGDKTQCRNRDKKLSRLEL